MRLPCAALQPRAPALHAAHSLQVSRRAPVISLICAAPPAAASEVHAAAARCVSLADRSQQPESIQQAPGPDAADATAALPARTGRAARRASGAAYGRRERAGAGGHQLPRHGLSAGGAPPTSHLLHSSDLEPLAHRGQIPTNSSLGRHQNG